jgi:very-short-patch-repair endonuclease
LWTLPHCWSFEDLARACHEAGIRYRTTPRQVERVLAKHPNARGSRKLRRVMRGESRVTLSKLERRFLELLRAHGLPLPVTNRRVGEHRVDCHWPDHGLIVELDSYTYHGSRHAWEQDRRRERAAYKRGATHHRRYTYRDVFEDPTDMLAELRELLAA